MTPTRMLPAILITLLLTATVGIAGDFGWMNDFNDRAQKDLSNFRARLEARFRIGDMQIGAVIDNAASPADAYAMLRLCEMSQRPVDAVIDSYRSEKGKGWGAVARRLGIKPGSPDFHALKQGQDIYGAGSGAKPRSKGRGKKSQKK